MGFCLKTTFRPLLYTLLFSTIVVGCDDDVKRIDTSGIDISITVDRFDESLNSISNNGIDLNELIELKTNYSQFFPLFVQGAIRVAGPNDSVTAIGLSRFVLDSSISQVADTVRLVYADMRKVEAELTEGFKHFSYYFPEKVIPKVVSFYSGFNYAQVADDSLLAIGLDMYLGANCSFYPLLGFPQYRFRNMTPDQISVDAMYSWLTTEYELQSGGNLLSQMIYFGKIHLALSYLLPDQPKHKSFGYSAEQLAWCLNNEAEIWSFLIDQELIYTNDNGKIRKFIGEGPFTAGFSEDAPSKLGQFIGWRIAQSFMKNQPNVSLQKLLELSDAQQLLNESNYKPNR